MKNLMGLVIAMAACSVFFPKEPPPPPEPPSTVVVVTPPTRTTEDGRRLENGPAKWCYGNGIDDDGECADTLEVCRPLRLARLDWETAAITTAKPGTDPSFAFKVAIDMWAACRLQEHAACFRGHQVVSGEHYELCYTSIGRCDLVLGNQKLTADLKPDADRCFVYRQ